jgi:hypothetical protein
MNIQTLIRSYSLRSHRLLRAVRLSFALQIMAVAGLCGCSTPAATYPTPDAAVAALVSALDPVDPKKVHQVLGSAGEEITNSGDPVEDRAAAGDFLAAYRLGHRLIETEDGSMMLELGNKQWTFPVPIVRQGDGWAFDCAAGKEEILNRRVGENEIFTITACMALVDAQREYAQMDPDGNGLQEYAGKFISDPGKRNGLYWPSADGKPQSPLGPMAASAAMDGYDVNQGGRGRPIPFHGYHYRMLKEQGPAAVGGARPFVAGGQQIGGFAFVASPVEYGNSGIMTFIVNQDGVVYQRDFGESTERQARGLKSFNPDSNWTKVAEVE